MATLSLALFALALANDAALPRTVARGRVPGHKDVTPEGAPAKGDTVINYLTSEVSALASSFAHTNPLFEVCHC